MRIRLNVQIMNCLNRLMRISLLFFAVFWVVSDSKYAYSDNCGFKDEKKHEYCSDIIFAKDQGWIGGYDKGEDKDKFLPNNRINRAEFTKIIMNAIRPSDTNEIDYYKNYINKSCFTDVDGEHWFARFVCKAKSDGIIGGYGSNIECNGYGNPCFRPERNVTYGEALKIILGAFKFMPSDHSWMSKDCKFCWYLPYITTADDYGFDILPIDEEITRGFMVHLLNQIYEESQKSQIKEPEDHIYLNGFEINNDHKFLSKFKDNGGMLGLPIGRSVKTVNGYTFQKFENGIIYNTGSNVLAVSGAIWKYYDTIGAASGSYLKLPESEREGKHSTGYYQVFKGAKLFERPGEFVVPYVPIIREDKCGIVTHSGFQSRNWEGLTLFENGEECGKICGSNGKGCHITAVAMIDAFYKKSSYKEYDLEAFNRLLGNNGAGATIGYDEQGRKVWINADGCEMDFKKSAPHGSKYKYSGSKTLNKKFYWKGNELIDGMGESYSKILDKHASNYLNKGKPIILQYQYFRGSEDNLGTLHAIVIVGNNNNYIGKEEENKGTYIVQDQFYPCFREPICDTGDIFVTLKYALEENKSKRGTTKVTFRQLIFYDPT